MVTRISLVKLRAIGRDQVLEQWLGPHADVVRALPQVRDYVVALAPEARPGSRWDAVATLRFDSEADLRDALEEPATARELECTRAPFISAVDAFVVEEHVVVRDGRAVA
jgi:EthD domain